MRTAIISGFFVGLGGSVLYVSYWSVARGRERRASAEASRRIQASRLEEELADTAAGSERWRELKGRLDHYEASQRAIHAAYETKKRILGRLLLGVGLGVVIAAALLAKDHWVALGTLGTLLLGACTGLFTGMIAAVVYQQLLSPIGGRGSGTCRDCTGVELAIAHPAGGHPPCEPVCTADLRLWPRCVGLTSVIVRRAAGLLGAHDKASDAVGLGGRRIDSLSHRSFINVYKWRLLTECSCGGRSLAATGMWR